MAHDTAVAPWAGLPLTVRGRRRDEWLHAGISGLARFDILILFAMAAWTLLPAAFELIHIARHGGSFTGQALLPPDLFQYLSWIRDAGTHGLISDHFQLVGPSKHVFFQPMFVVSGLLWRLGLSLPLAYLLPWAPAGVALTFFGFRAYVRRHVADPAQGRAALLLALFFLPPATALAIQSGHAWGGLADFNIDGSTAFALWGFFPRALAVALLPMVLLAVEQLVTAPSPRSLRRPLAVAGTLALIVAWLHPWQGMEVVIIVLGFLAWSQPARANATALLVVVGAAAAPLLYYQALSHFDFFWRTSQAQSANSLVFSPLVVVLGLLPLIVMAILGARRRLPSEPHRRLLLLWLGAAVLTAVVVPSDGAHALNGITLPLAVLAVQGWRRVATLREVRGRRLLFACVCSLAIAACTLPGALVLVSSLARGFHRGATQLMARDDFRALRYLEHAPRGGVIASMRVAPAVPALTGHNIFAGDFPWTPNFTGTGAYDTALYAGTLPVATARQLVAAAGARFLLADCRPHAQFARTLAPLIVGTHRFGCATVYDLRVQA